MYLTDSTNRYQPDCQSTVHRPIRILQVIGGMVRGGIETWLMHVLRHIDRDRFQIDFLVHTHKPGDYDEEIRALGSRIIPCPLYRWNPWKYAANFQRILCEYGPYDIVHSHVHHFSGYVLRLASQAGVPVRLAHSHNDLSSATTQIGLYRGLYNTLTKGWINSYATMGLGCSRPATANLFGLTWDKDPRWQLFYYSIDLTTFQNGVDAIAVRAELGIPLNAFVVGHVGRFAAQKNHEFLIEIAAEVVQREANVYFLLLGEGSLRATIQQKAEQKGLGDRIIFAGSRPDIPRLMRGAMDIFLLPSRHEGLPLVMLEAQASGIPCFVSDVVSEEADIVKPLVHRLSLLQPASEWATALLNHKDAASIVSQADALAVLEPSPFNIKTSVKQLEKIYQDLLMREVAS